MKVRDGFVSNSSSTCWVLDIRQDGVKELVDKCKHVAGPGYLDRCTALAQGKGVKWYAKDWIEAVSDYGDDYRGLGHWILEWAEKIGHWQQWNTIKEYYEDKKRFCI